MKKYTAIMSDNSGIIEIRENYLPVFQAYPPLNKSVDKLLPINQKYENLITISQKPLHGQILEKTDNEDNLINSLCIILPIMNLFAFQNNDQELYDATKISFTEIRRKTPVQLLALCEHCFNLTEKYKDKWEQIGITQEMVDNMLNDKENYKNSIKEPSATELEIIQAHKDIDTLYAENRTIIYQEILPTVKFLFHKSHPNIISQIETLLKTHKPAVRKRAVIGKVVNAVTNEEIEYPIIEILEKGTKRRSKSKKGNFHIQNLDPGEYTAQCSHAKFHTTTLKFIHSWGATERIVIKMQPKEPTPIQTQSAPRTRTKKKNN